MSPCYVKLQTKNMQIYLKRILSRISNEHLKAFQKSCFSERRYATASVVIDITRHNFFVLTL